MLWFSHIFYDVFYRICTQKKYKSINKFPSQNGATGKLEELTTTKQKLSKRNAELKEDLTRETKLRQSLEESQTAQMNRLKEMEDMMEVQKNEVSYINPLTAHGDFAQKKFW